MVCIGYNGEQIKTSKCRWNTVVLQGRTEVTSNGSFTQIQPLLYVLYASVIAFSMKYIIAKLLQMGLVVVLVIF